MTRAGEIDRPKPIHGRVSQKAALIVSLDLELYWGVHDVRSLDSWRHRLLETRKAVERILGLFEEYGVHATWATVGFLFFRTREECMNGLPDVWPEYREPRFSPYPRLHEMGANEAEDPSRFGSSILKAIRNTPHQEIGTHTFAHSYCLEDGMTEAAFRADLAAASRIAAKWNVNLRSLVFPRNQVNRAFLSAAAEAGIECYRGTSSHWIYRERKKSDESQVRRAVRLLDAYLNVSGHHTIHVPEATADFPLNYPASRLLRGYSPALRLLESLRVARICSGLKAAARRRHLYHLWFHPEELALDQDRNMAALHKILRGYATLRDRGEMESVNMGELAARHIAARENGRRALASDQDYSAVLSRRAASST